MKIEPDGHQSVSSRLQSAKSLIGNDRCRLATCEPEVHVAAVGEPLDVEREIDVLFFAYSCKNASAMALSRQSFDIEFCIPGFSPD